MKLSASNIGWSREEDPKVLKYLHDHLFSGLEIAPTRIWEQHPYEKTKDAVAFVQKMKSEYGLSICSMQSIWYGKRERIAGSAEERRSLLCYTEEAICFAERMGCENIVFGCPRNRSIQNASERTLVVDFLRQIAEIAEQHHTVIALEANPPIYHTNFANTTEDALSIIREVGNPALLLNLDFGTVIENSEDIRALSENVERIHHVHISEPNLVSLERREDHRILRQVLENGGYQRYVSLEMGASGNMENLMRSLDYLCEVFG